MKVPVTNCTVRADLPTPPLPNTTTLYSLIESHLHQLLPKGGKNNTPLAAALLGEAEGGRKSANPGGECRGAEGRTGEEEEVKGGGGERAKCRGGWGWDGNALPIGTEAQAGGVGKGRALSSPEEGGGRRDAPPEGKWRGDAAGPTGTPAGRQASKEPAVGGCPAPLLRPSHKGAQGPRFLLAPPSRPGPVGSAPVAVARAGLWAAAAAGVVRPVKRGERARVTSLTPAPAGQPGRPPPAAPTRTRPPPPPLTLPSAPARPPGKLCHAKAMARGRFLGLTASPALPLAEGKGAGAVRRRRRPLGLQANPPLFFLTPPPHPPSTHPEGFP